MGKVSELSEDLRWRIVDLHKFHLKSSARRLKHGRLEWPSQNPNLNPIENLWAMLKHPVCARKPTNLNGLYQFCQEEQSNIQPELCQELVDGCKKHLVKVQCAKSHLTQY